MKLHLAGLNHKTAPVELRERVAFDAAVLDTCLRELKHFKGLEEGLILSTCNRVEVYSHASSALDKKWCNTSIIAARSLWC